MKRTPLSQLASVSAGQGAPKDSEFSESGIPFVRAGSLEALLSGKKESDLELVSAETAKLRKLKTYPKGTILFAKSGMSATKDRVYVLQNPAHVVSHLATLIPKDGAHVDYLRLALKRFPPSSLIKDPAYPTIGLGEIENFEIPVPEEFDNQIRIAHLLSKVEGLIAQRKQHLQHLDDLLKSVFLEIFGDPVRNEKGWDKPALTAFGKISTGNTPPRSESANYDGDFIEWIKTDNITGDAVCITPSAEHLSEIGARKARTVTSGALLVACIAGSVESIGRAALTDRTVSFNQQINAIQPGKDVNPLYLYGLFKLSRSYIQSHATKGMKKILTKGDFEKITMIKPSFEIQNQFAVIFEKVESIKSRYKQSLTDLETLYGALSQQAFKGELDLSRVPIPAQLVEPVSPGDQATVPEPVVQTVPAIHLPDTGNLLAALENSEARKALIAEWLEAYRQQLGGAPFSVQDFMAAVSDRLTEWLQTVVEDEGVTDEQKNRLAEFYPSNDVGLDVNDYEHIKKWIFEALVANRLTQSINVTGYDEQSGEPIFGNLIELKASQT
ncbi:restriction endonuclease subunit S [Burkholderia cenocepacia]|uniref:restriction endonuclease subunit S n=1 Tax=Burkholderia cenocepacia TaxID=95486 RepID=UPI00285EB4D6|nr:restriction endonuclease subunit S [Burkholderia cenocepacia]MDR8025687.1 restriction endonuclease subunit S [Burkholderia cenocepacia]MDR8042927.1 restriction endonuclease subunit S [Burkholderia cenocepacia]MDR8079438.1 restriction endonuclease subunit S [Burkholderia cenocepacia]